MTRLPGQKAKKRKVTVFDILYPAPEPEPVVDVFAVNTNCIPADNPNVDNSEEAQINRYFKLCPRQQDRIKEFITTMLLRVENFTSKNCDILLHAITFATANVKRPVDKRSSRTFKLDIINEESQRCQVLQALEVYNLNNLNFFNSFTIFWE